ncbi:MAG TPA: hypothetical protein VMV73_04660, partial [Candidatus Dormibacteraeota bacterium]|nr:hypothetical protein [Candidatus Dormibacteraeota bacterium]
MKLHYALFGVVATAALLAACGGGGGVPSLSSTASPIGGPGNPAATSSSRPASVGDTFAFAGASLESDVYTYPVASPFPNTTAAAQITENVVVTASANPLGSGGTDFHAVTTTAAAQVTHTATSDAYYSTVAAGSGTNFVLNAQQSVDDSNNKFVWNYTTPQILDEIPETSGATWTNSPAGTYAETDADGATVARTIAASGTYSETDTFPGTALPVQIAVNADGSGTLSENYFNFLPIDFAYSAPTAGAISISYLIPTPAPAPGATGTPAPNPPTVIATPAAWFSPSPTLYSESDTV